MKLLKKEQKYSIIKIYKIVDLKQAKEIDSGSIFSTCVDFIHKNENTHPYVYGLNYGQKNWKTLKSFKNAISKIDKTDIVYLNSYFNDSKSSIILHNNILNLSKTPYKSIVAIKLAFKENDKINLIYLKEFLKNIYSQCKFDYGYVTYLNSNYDFHSEKKKKRTLFGFRSPDNDLDIIWNFHSIGVIHGFVRNLYPVNIINQSHLSHPIISEIINTKGSLEMINDYVGVWKLDEDELKSIKNDLSKSELIIANEMSTKYFLESDQAKEFNSQMALPV